MNLSKAHLAKIEAIEKVIGVKLEAFAIKRNCFAVELPDSKYCSESSFYTAIYDTCRQYGIGRVEPCGVGRLSVIF